MSAALYVVVGYLLLWPLSWLAAFVGGWLDARRGVTDVEFVEHVQRLDGHVHRSFAYRGYEIGCRRPGGLAGMGGGAGI